MTVRKAKMQHLNVFLMQDGCKEFEDAFRDESEANEIQIVKKRGFEAGLYVLRSPPKEPAWLSFLRDGHFEIHYSLSDI